MNHFPLSNLFRLSGDLTFLNYTQSSCVTALISVCLPSVLPFQMQTCVTVYPLCVTSLLQQIHSSGNQVKVKFISGTFVPLRFTACHMLIIWILNMDQKKINKIMFWLLTDIFNGLFHSPFGKPHTVLGFTEKCSCWKVLADCRTIWRAKAAPLMQNHTKQTRYILCILMLYGGERRCICPLLSPCVLNVRNVMQNPAKKVHTHCVKSYTTLKIMQIFLSFPGNKSAFCLGVAEQ